jgi:hypothetical protein
MRITGQRVVPKEVQELDEKPFGPTKANETWKFISGKFNPIFALGVHAWTGSDYSGKPTTVQKELTGMITPMSVGEFVKGAEQDGMKGLVVRGVPSFFGVKVSNEADFPRKLPEVTAMFDGKRRQLDEKEIDKLAAKRESIIKADEQIFKTRGIYVVEKGDAVLKKYNQLSEEQVKKEMTKIRTNATKKAKEELFGSQELDPEDKAIKNIADKMNNILYSE